MPIRIFRREQAAVHRMAVARFGHVRWRTELHPTAVRQWIAAGRFFNGKTPKTKLASLDVEKNTIEPILELPSGGDTSYPGLVWHDDSLWVSYYSSHEGKTNIYLAKVRGRIGRISTVRRNGKLRCICSVSSVSSCSEILLN